MTTTLHGTTPRFSDFNCDAAAPVLRVFIAYESVEIGLQALQLYQRVAKKFGREYRFQLDLWKFEALGVPSLGKHASEEVAAADLIIIAASRDDRVPLDLRRWTETWGERKAGRESALVLLSGRCAGALISPASMAAYLREIATRQHMTFLSDSIGSVSRVRNAFMEQLQERTSLGAVPAIAESRTGRSVLACR